MSREKVSDEIVAELIEHIRGAICTWEMTDKTSLEKLNGLAFSILVALDGDADGIPQFIVAPRPHHEDKQFNIERGFNYYPENHLLDEKLRCDIGGNLHEHFFHVRKEDVSSTLAKRMRRHREEYEKLMGEK
ncbi:hypothetical protein [Saccharibacillus sp. JS10]|uniref:hypothetical protein n=1 Tax=Saccharibacillus sp. JS10 TaxID=2950552 RepID=UPI00210C21D0|nr:hypothetical protein [Saccharibacillus sp. JS10]MCQ4085873.1 hypothetical protein [Saccharibacillus sp. JS10]